mmetsp:Transcript_23357/g.32631  ORF Transcript_23357/g.32631 Transcript_23357/m.32631 type:complete len:329 (+) Transcript_23357:47-1033(+)
MASRKSCSSSEDDPQATPGSTPHNIASEKQGDPQREKKHHAFPNLTDFFDRTKPWVLVPDGSYNGFFDWVPEKLRHGQWSIVAVIYLPFIITTISAGVLWAYLRPQDDWSWKDESNGMYPEPGSLRWCYNTFIFLWISFLNSTMLTKSTMWSWATYTLWSWTTLWIRHGLSVLFPLFPHSQILKSCIEYLRFPCLATASITFLVWNFVLLPGIYFFGMKDAEKKKEFLKFMFTWKLVQLHIFNIYYAITNCIFTSPVRLLNYNDFAAAAVQALAYVLWYLCVMDRLGIHTYPVFSPRTPWCLVSWSMILVFYIGLFFFWNNILEKVGN